VPLPPPYARRFHPLRAILTEIHLCHTCSRHEILRMDTPGQAPPLTVVSEQDGLDAPAQLTTKPRSTDENARSDRVGQAALLGAGADPNVHSR
jgi:hypothetical protein